MMRLRFHPRRGLSIAMVVPGLATLTGCGSAGDAVPLQAQTTSEAPTPRVSTVLPERGTIRRVTSEPGQIEAFETTDLLAKVAGYVRSLAVDIGDPVEAGQVLAELDAPELEAELDRKQAHLEQDAADLDRARAMVEVAQAAVATAQAGIQEARAATRRSEAEIDRWQAEYDRIDRLVSERAVTEGLRDETLSKLEAARASRDEVEAQIQLAEAVLLQAEAERARALADVRVGEAHVRVAEADVRHAEAMKSFTRIVAPFNGIVTKRFVDTGHLTDPGGSRDPLLSIARTDIVRVVVGVPEVDAPLVDVGDRAEIRVQALGGRTFEGTVTRASWALDRATRTLRAEIDLENSDRTLQAGLYVYVSIVAEQRDEVLTLPLSAVLTDDEGQSSSVVIVDGRIQRRALELGLSDGTRVEVRAGLKEGEPVVTSDPSAFDDGQAVEVIEASF
ncbi:efflux RND transporter periplasmic adaptor subunit [Tautonia marina]|uniref:efflux RND transporter periplasmic adaptor subunit n=1 Tax=Tautonia marina TaxID=2653855 RepID=UPI001260B0C4|nr:efflux RND transporter periplasmic adaptor subunit [Tautonia marina]